MRAGCAGSPGYLVAPSSHASVWTFARLPSSACCPHSAKGSSCIQEAVRVLRGQYRLSRDDGHHLQLVTQALGGMGHGALRRPGVMQAETSVCEPFGSGLPNRTQLPFNGSGGSSRIDVSCVLASPTSWCSRKAISAFFSWITRMLPNGPPGACLAFLQPAHCSVAGIIM